MNYRQREQRHVINEDVFDADSNQKIGYTLNISTFGMLMISKQAYSEDEILRVRVTMSLEHEERVSMNMLAECRWSSRIANTPFHQNGFHFSQPNPVYAAYTKTLFNAIQ